METRNCLTHGTYKGLVCPTCYYNKMDLLPVEMSVATLIAEVIRLRAQVESMSEDCDLLAALQGAGVDNWCGYDLALESMEGD